ncbi:MAG: hypothetical protein ACUVX8_01530 [Candidatus Zipacnadales bacterium]
MILQIILAVALDAAAQPSPWLVHTHEPRWQGSEAWRNSDFAVLQSELSPAVLLSSKSNTLHLFAGLTRWGLGGPSHLGFHSAEGMKSLPCFQEVRVPGTALDRPWLWVSFQGSSGWQAWDVPWLVVLQRRPTSIGAGQEGLTLEFSGPAGLVALLPGHGALKLTPPEQGSTPRPPGLEETMCDLWSRALRYWPLNCHEQLRLNPNADTLTVRAQYKYIEVKDDWGTVGTRLAPLPPTLALALQTGFPAKVTPPLERSPNVPTAYGPYTCVASDTYTVEFSIRHLHQTEVFQPPNTEDPIVVLAANEIAQRMETKFTDSELDRIWDHGGGNNYCWQVMGDRYYAKALAYTTEQTRQDARECMAKYVREWVLNEAKYKPFRGKLLLEGPGIGNWGGYDDSGKFSSNILETLWWYAHCTRDWDIIRERWDTVQKLFVTPRECRWRGFGREAIAEMGDEAAPPMCMARLAYAVGDMDTYAYAAYIYVHELVHLWVKTQPQCAEWFRSLQPWEGGEPMEGRLWLTNLWGDVAGWRLDGPDYPQETGERQYRNRWVRFGNEDVAAFMRDTLGEEILRKELDWWLTRPDNPYQPGVSTAHIAPSMEQLRSLLLNESPAELAKWTPMQEARLGRAADAISYYLSFVRTGRPLRYERLVSTDLPPSPWMLGLEREAESSDGCLVVACLIQDGHWPVLSDWRAWKPPQEPADLPGADRWPYGQLIAGPTPPPNMRWEQLNWVTNVRYAP